MGSCSNVWSVSELSKNEGPAKERQFGKPMLNGILIHLANAIPGRSKFSCCPKTLTPSGQLQIIPTLGEPTF